MARLFYHRTVGIQLIFSVLLLLCGCERKPEAPVYFLQKTVTDTEGNSTTWQFSGPSLPPMLMPREIASDD